MRKKTPQDRQIKIGDERKINEPVKCQAEEPEGSTPTTPDLATGQERILILSSCLLLGLAN